MKFSEVVEQAIELLRRKDRITYRQQFPVSEKIKEQRGVGQGSFCVCVGAG
jgi:hypothetical protein